MIVVVSRLRILPGAEGLGPPFPPSISIHRLRAKSSMTARVHSFATLNRESAFPRELIGEVGRLAS
jgi:hypothetical protein